jgi:hypothetical protein
VRGDVIRVSWCDIQEDSTGDPDLAHLARRVSYGVFWARRKDQGVDVLVTTTTLDADGSQQQGSCCYPLACVLSMTVVKRARRSRRHGAIERRK